jgi:hypothetical protein
MIGEITNETNSADAFALLHVPWVSGYAFGYVTLETIHSVVLILNVQGSDWRLVGKPSHQFSILVSFTNLDRSSVFPPMHDYCVLFVDWLLDHSVASQ